MDAVASWDGTGFWHVSERPSMRSLGEIARVTSNHFTIEPDDNSPLSGISSGPYASFDEVLKAVAAHLQGRCELTRFRRRL
jgi:hypothetical protein